MVMKMCVLFSFFLFFISFGGCENVIKPTKKENLDLYNYDVEQKITTSDHSNCFESEASAILIFLTFLLIFSMA